MTDPFQNLRAQGLPTVGYGVLDAPSQQDREIALKAQQGQGLSAREIQRLAQRQGVELETARVARASTGFGGAGVPVSTVDFLAGTRLDPRVQQAAAAEAVLAGSPEVAAARRQQAVDVLDPVGAELRRRGVGTAAGNELANYDLAARLAAQNGTTIEVAQQLLAPVSFETPPAAQAPAQELAQAVVAPPPVPAAPVLALPTQPPVQPSSPFEEAKSRVIPLPQPERERQARITARGRAASSGVPLSLMQLRALESDAVEAARTLTSQKSRYKDTRTNHTMEFETVVDGLGNVVRVVDPVMVSADPVTKALDDSYIKEYQEWTGKGANTAASNVAALDRSIAKLLDPNGPQLSGPLVGTLEAVPFLGKLSTRVFLPEMKETRDAVITVGQNTIREVFGSNPAQAEAQRLLDRIYDPTGSEEENARRVTAFRNMIASGAKLQQEKAQYFEQNGTMAGYRGPELATLVSQAAQEFEKAPAMKATGPGAPRVSPEAVKSYLSGG